MPRKRMIDPGIWQSEQIARLTRDQRLLFIGIFSNADDEGRLKGSPKFLKMAIFPGDEDITSEDIHQWRDAIASCTDGDGLAPIRVYVVNGMEYIDLPSWSHWQRIDKPSKSILPPFDDDSQIIPQPFDECSTTVPSEEKEMKERKQKKARPAATAAEVPERLTTFDATLRQLQGYKPTEQFFDTVLSRFGSLDLDFEAVKAVEWALSHEKRKGTTSYVLNWLQNVKPDQTRQNGSATAAPAFGRKTIKEGW